MFQSALDSDWNRTLFSAERFPRLYVHPFQSPINRNPLQTPSNVKHSEPELDVPGFICEGVPHFHCQLALTRSCFTSVRMSRLVKIKITAHSCVGFFFSSSTKPSGYSWDTSENLRTCTCRIASLQERGKKKSTDWDLEWIYLDILHVAGSQAFLDHSSLGMSNKPISARFLKQARAGTENAPRSHQIGLLGSKSVGKDEQDQIKKLNFLSSLLGR